MNRSNQKRIKLQQYDEQLAGMQIKHYCAEQQHNRAFAERRTDWNASCFASLQCSSMYLYMPLIYTSFLAPQKPNVRISHLLTLSINRKVAEMIMLDLQPYSIGRSIGLQRVSEHINHRVLSQAGYSQLPFLCLIFLPVWS